MISRLKHLYRREDKSLLFLEWLYGCFFVLTGIAALIDFSLGIEPDCYIEALFTGATLIVYLVYRITGDRQIGKIGLVTLATLITYALLIANSFQTSYFVIIVTLSYFFLFSFRFAAGITLVHLVAVVMLFFYGYRYREEWDYFPDVSTLIGIVIAFIYIVLFGLFYQLAIRKSYESLKRVNRHNELLLQEIHHRVKNNLNIIASLLGLQQLSYRHRPDVYELLEQNRLRIEAIATIHEQLYRHDDYEHITLSVYLERLTATVLRLYDETGIVVNTEADAVTVPFEIALKIGIVTNELLSNTVKHTLHGGNNRVTIRLHHGNDGREGILRYRYEEASPMTREAGRRLRNATGLGLKIVTMMVKELRGELTLVTFPSLRFDIRIPHV